LEERENGSIWRSLFGSRGAGDTTQELMFCTGLTGRGYLRVHNF